MGITRFRGGTKPDILAKLMAAHVPEDDLTQILMNTVEVIKCTKNT